MKDRCALPLDRGGSAVLEDGFLTVASYHPPCTDHEQPMHSLPAEGAQLWFVAKAAVALGPIVTFEAAKLIRWSLRRMRQRRPGDPPRSGSAPAAPGSVTDPARHG